MRLAYFVFAAALVSATAHGQEARRDEPEPSGEAAAPTLTRPPQLIEAAHPEYPAAAIEAGIEGAVRVRLHIDATGAVANVDVVAGLGHGLDEAAVAAAGQYRFSPAHFDGVPGPIVVETAIRFVLEKKLEPAAHAPDDVDSAVPAVPTSKVRGRVRVRGTREPVAGAIVSVAEAGVDTVTDERGRFEVDVPMGAYTLLIAADGFSRLDRKLDVAADEQLSVELYVRKKGSSPYETLVEGETERLEVTRRTIDRRQMTTVPGTFGDPVRVIQALPGMARSPFSTGFLLIRGSNPGDSGIFIDGHEVPLLFHSLGGPSFLNPEFLEEINLYPGGFPVRFGRATGGVVAVESRTPPHDRVRGSADLDLFDAGGYLGTPVGKHGGLSIAGRQSYLDLMLPAFLPDSSDGNTLLVTPVYRDYNARFDYSLGRHGDVSMFVLGSADRMDVISTDGDTGETRSLGTTTDFFRVIGSYKRKLSGDLRMTLSTALGWDSIDFAAADGEDAPPTTRIGAGQETIGSRMRIDGKVGDRVKIDTGLDFDSRRVKVDLLAPLQDDVRAFDMTDVPEQELVFHTDEVALGAYVEAAIDAGHGITVIPGIRTDVYSMSGETRVGVDPRAVARWKFDDDWTAKAYGGLFHQSSAPITFDERFGNPDLDLERAVHTGVGAEWSFAPQWRADLELYRIGRDNLVAFDEADNFANSGDGHTYGAEVMIKRNVTDNLYGWVSYTLSQTERRDRPDDPLAPSAFDQTHVLNAVASYRTDGGWELGARYRLASGTPQTPIMEGTFDADSNTYRPVMGEPRSERAKTFQQFDVRLEKTWAFDTWTIAAYLDVQNVLNTENVEATQYDYRFRDSAPITSLPLVPSLGVKGTF